MNATATVKLIGANRFIECCNKVEYSRCQENKK